MVIKIKFILRFLLIFTYIVSQVEEVGDSLFTVTEEGQIVNIPYFSNESNFENNDDVKRIIIVVHGQNRNANDYFEYIEEAAISTSLINETLIFSPQFLTSQDINYWSLDSSFVFWSGTTQWTGGDLSSSTEENPRSYFLSSFSIIDSVIYSFLDTYSSLEDLVLIGNSAGGQLVNRYLSGTTLSGDGKIRYVVCAPSHYLYFNDKRSLNNFETPIFWGEPENCNGYNNYRYGLDNLNDYMSSSSIDSIRSRYYRKKVHYLVGDLDFGGTNYCQSNLQGENRFQRAIVYYQHLLDFFGTEIIFNHKISLVEGVSHSAYDLFNSDCGLYSIFYNGFCNQISNLVFPIASFNIYNNSGSYPLEVSFINESNSGTHPIISSVWGFGNQNFLNSNNLIENYVYTQPGEYTVCLTSYDIIGLSDSLEIISAIQVDTVFGDLNWDTSVNYEDASLVLKHIVKTDTLTSLQIKTGEVDGFNLISTYDASLILQHSEGYVEELPFVEPNLVSSGYLYSEDQNIAVDGVITVPIFSDSLINLYSFILKLNYNSDHLTFGSSYFGDLSDSSFLYETNSFEDTVIIAGSSASPIGGNSLYIDLYFLSTDSFPEQTTVSFYETIFNKNDTLPSFSVTLNSSLNIEQNQEPNQISVFQNYPNPFNSQTTITYQLIKDSFVDVYITDIMGRQIKSLVSRDQKRGLFSLIWDSTGFLGEEVSSGIYYYTIKTYNKTITKKMILIR